jgi:hypothetical protein
VEETAGQLVYAIDDASDVHELLQLASKEMRAAIRQFVHQAPRTNEEWAAMPFLVLDGNECDVARYRSRVRSAIEALRQQLS